MLKSLKIGDYLLSIALASLCFFWFFQYWFNAPLANSVNIYSKGKLFARVNLLHKQTLQIPGPLGISVIEVDAGKVRVAKDPSPRQYCVQQGWLSRSGQVALCLPNQISIEILGNKKNYDSLNY